MSPSPFIWKEEFVLRKSWTDVMRAAQLKYPNPFNPSVLSMDVLSRRIDKNTGTLHTTKMINSSWPMFSSAGELRAVELSVVDPQKQYMLLECDNVDLRSVLKASEKLEYKVHPTNKDWTIIQHSVSIDAFPLIAYPALSVSKKTAHLGRDALLWVLENRANAFMKPVEPITTFSQKCTGLGSRCLDSPGSLSLTERIKSLRAGNFIHPLVAFAESYNHSRIPTLLKPPSVQSEVNSMASGSEGLNTSLRTLFSSFDLFNQSNLCEFASTSFDTHLSKVSSNMNSVRESLRAKCQRVADRFSKIDEYFLIM